ncbi:MAG: hypothetical protein P9L92_17480 [Candidatus Electryonea clarkiae]|nr:hypothetical protein [Candidatus Electryonea clarkiae]MDP8286759.1 hypothetical protein [Candidatus Electryonea clarkiae]
MRHRIGLAGIFLLLIFSRSFSQDLEIVTTGARALGMGGAYIGEANDVSALFWNPAGLVKIDHPEAVFDYISNSREHEPNFYMKNYGYTINNTSDYKNIYSSLAGYAYPINSLNRRVVLAIAYQRQLDFYCNYSYVFNTHNSEGGAYSITPGIGVEILPSLSIGVTGNFWRGTHQLNINYYDDIYKTTMYFNESYDYSFSGNNLTAGLSIDFDSMDINLPLKAGAMIRTPFDLTGDFQFDYHDLVNSEYGYLNGDVKIEMPMMLGAGVSLKLGKDVTITADYETRMYSDRDFILTPDGDTVSSEAAISAAEVDLNQVRAGFEYRVPWQTRHVPLRIGYSTLPKLDCDAKLFEFVEPSYSAVTTKQVSLGCGLETMYFNVNTAVLFSNYSTEVEDDEIRENTYWNKRTIITNISVFFK